MKFAVGIPRCNEPSDLLIETLSSITMSSQLPLRILIIDNGDERLNSALAGDIPVHVIRPGANIGCAGAWNTLMDTSPLPMIIVNADLAVAPDTFERMLSSRKEAIVCAFGFGCFLIPRPIWDRVGPFDEAFHPVYWEDTDYRYRCKLAGVELDEWPIDEVERVSEGRKRIATGIVHGKPGGAYQGWTGEKLAWFHDCLERNRQRYIAKWGGGHTEEKFTVPFDGKSA